MKGIEKIKTCLDEFVENGGDVNFLTKKDSVYMLVKNTEVYIDEKRLTIEEKFKLAGYPRKGKEFSTAEEKLIHKVNKYISEGGDLNKNRKSLPFYEELHSAIRSKRKTLGYHISDEDYMKSLGFRQYSDRYKRFVNIFKLKEFKDNYGYVDSYRKNSEMKNYIHGCSETLNVPIAVVVELIGDQKLQKVVVDTDYMVNVRDGLIEYLKENGDFSGIKRKAPGLYERLSALANYIMGSVGEKLSKADVVELLDLNDSMAVFKQGRVEVESIEPIMNKLRDLADKNGGSITRGDIEEREYRKLLAESMRQGCYLSGLFDAYKINYTGGRSNKRLKKAYSNQFPFMDEMKKERDDDFSRFLKQNQSLTKEEKFEAYLEICLGVYQKYKSKVYNFEIDDEEIKMG